MFPNDATEWLDTDSDGIGDNADSDWDNDNLDVLDAPPLDATESLDTDGDGIGNNTDTDDDGDGVADSADLFPLDRLETIDTDKDGLGNNADTDDDNDGVLDTVDAFPLDATESEDKDRDGVGDNKDPSITISDPPELTALTVSTSNVDVSSGAQVIKFTLTATDNDGIRWSNYVNISGPWVELASVSVFLENGDHSAYLTLKPTDINGDWNIDFVSLKDDANQRSNTLRYDVNTDTNNDGTVDKTIKAGIRLRQGVPKAITLVGGLAPDANQC